MSASGDGGKALHELVHQIQDALIAQNTRRIRELEAVLERDDDGDPVLANLDNLSVLPLELVA
jgi:hypothetical protein